MKGLRAVVANAAGNGVVLFHELIKKMPGKKELHLQWNLHRNAAEPSSNDFFIEGVRSFHYTIQPKVPKLYSLGLCA